MKCSARFASQERRLRRRPCAWWGHEFRAQLALRAKTGAFGAPSYRTGTGEMKKNPILTECNKEECNKFPRGAESHTSRDYRQTDRRTETESEQEICPGLLLLTS